MSKFRIASLIIAAMLAACGNSVSVKDGEAARDAGDHKKAEKIFLRLADQGNVEAQEYLGYLYGSEGSGVELDHAKALKWYRKAADQGSANAYTQLGFMFEMGKGVPKNDFAALFHWEKAAELGNYEEQTHLAREYASRGDYYKAAKWWQRLADIGHFDAKEMLGDLYWNGQGVPQDYKKAIDLYLESAQKGWGHSRLGSIYENGEGGVERDLVKAYMHYNLEGKSGERRRNQVMTEMTTEQILKAQAMSKEWLNRYPI